MLKLRYLVAIAAASAGVIANAQMLIVDMIAGPVMNKMFECGMIP